MEYIIVVVFLVILTLKRYLDKTFVNDFLLVIGPYVVIVFINNIFMVNYLGFYAVKGEVLNAVLIAVCSYALGSLIASILGRKYTLGISRMDSDIDNNDRLTLKIDSASRYTMFVCIIMLIWVASMVLINGFGAVKANDFDLLRLRGISGHLFISLYAIVPALFFESIQTRHKLGIISSAFAVAISFTTFVKYNVILMVLAIGLYYMFKKKSAYKKVLLILVAFILGMFLLNYIVLFFVQSGLTSDTSTFLKSHLWMYISSGVLMMNYIVGNGSIHYGVVDFIVQSIGAFPNMILSLFTSFRVTTGNSYQSILSQMPVMSLSGERSNALSVLGTFFSNGDNVIAFIFTMMVWGLFVGYIILKTRYKNFNKVSMVGVYFIAFNILSFFANYWLLSMSWEVLIFCLLFGKIFNLNGGVSIKCGNWTIL